MLIKFEGNTCVGRQRIAIFYTNVSKFSRKLRLRLKTNVRKMKTSLAALLGKLYPSNLIGKSHGLVF